ncbi:MAG: uL22 family ribosomal protein, partial [Candidatus Aenigmarchaeota archaeon]|nr:uL22 family ribosomal protein [Candidatus Aenigmarchaeota archaeon]MDI6722040.1 uL22 family ribosomal protein [Candidatus Aenigmarchaeota archaeon]
EGAEPLRVGVMAYSFVPKKKYAKASGRNIGISTKSAGVLCRVIRKKPLKRAKRLLVDLESRKRSLGGKYYSKTVMNIRKLVESCEKNAEFAGLDTDRLMVHASAHEGMRAKRRRRKAAFGNMLKRANIEVMLIERGKSDKISMEKIKEQTK